MEDGESLLADAARELREETGLAVVPEALGHLVAEASGYADLGWAKGVFHDTFFFHRTTVHEVDTSGFEDGERSQISAHRWCALDEVARASDPIYPFGLAPLLADLLAGRIPAEPIRLPWHH